MNEKRKKKIEMEELDEDPYTEEGREVAVEADEIDELEEGFMEGYDADKGEQLAKCTVCKKPIYDKAIEKEFKNKLYRFCSDYCADVFNRSSKKWSKLEEEKTK